MTSSDNMVEGDNEFYIIYKTNAINDNQSKKVWQNRSPPSHHTHTHATEKNYLCSYCFLFYLQKMFVTEIHPQTFSRQDVLTVYLYNFAVECPKIARKAM